MNGKIVFYKDKEGYGFISASDSENYFFHVSNVKTNLRPQVGQSVEFTPSKNKKGLCALNVKNWFSDKIFTYGNYKIPFSDIKSFGIKTGTHLFIKLKDYKEVKKNTITKGLFGRKKVKTEIVEKTYYNGKLDDFYSDEDEIDTYHFELDEIDFDDDCGHTAVLPEVVENIIRKAENENEDDYLATKCDYFYIVTFSRLSEFNNQYIHRWYEGQHDINSLMAQMRFLSDSY